MRVGVIGPGGVGGYFGGRLAMAGHDVAFVGRGSHLAAIQERGLQVRSVNGDFSVAAMASDNPAELGCAMLRIPSPRCTTTWCPAGRWSLRRRTGRWCAGPVACDSKLLPVRRSKLSCGRRINAILRVRTRHGHGHADAADARERAAHGLHSTRRTHGVAPFLSVCALAARTVVRSVITGASASTDAPVQAPEVSTTAWSIPRPASSAQCSMKAAGA
jgi:hypothetical protein